MLDFYPSHYNTGLVSSEFSLTLWGEGASLAVVDHLSSDGITIKIRYEVAVLLHRHVLHRLSLSAWLELNLVYC